MTRRAVWVSPVVQVVGWVALIGSIAWTAAIVQETAARTEQVACATADAAYTLLIEQAGSQEDADALAAQFDQTCPTYQSPRR